MPEIRNCLPIKEVVGGMEGKKHKGNNKELKHISAKHEKEDWNSLKNLHL